MAVPLIGDRGLQAEGRVGGGAQGLVAGQVTTLRSIGLASDRAPIAMQAADGTIVEVFEWASAEAIQAAHAHPVVLQMWEQLSRVCDYVPVGSLSESSNLFADYTPVATDVA